MTIQNSKFKFIIFVLGLVLILSLTGNIWLIQKNQSDEVSRKVFSNQTVSSLAKPVSAKEIYSFFECPCCGSPIDECTCPMAKERRSYIDALIEVGKESSKEEIILSYIKKYGLGSFLDEEKQKEFRQKLIKEAPANRPTILITPKSRRLGDISRKQGIVTTTFLLKNVGKSDLVISKIETSCGCTSASIFFEGKEGPKFSMPGHGANEKIKNWQVVIPPQKTAELRVYYDPNFHSDFRGTAIRTISIFSNDPVDFEKKVQIELNQID